jgi:hypothetical protein
MLGTLKGHVGRNAVSYLALFVALGGTSYAAIKLPANSVGSAQIKKNAVRSSDVKNATLTAKDFKAGQLPAGAQGAPGAPGAKGATGTPGAPGAPGTSVFAGSLPAGKTMTGVWGASVTVATAGDGYRAYASFPLQLADGIPSDHVVYVPGTSATNCPGPGQAAAGFLCVYQGDEGNTTGPTTGNIFNPEDEGGGAGSGRRGFAILIGASTAGLSGVGGSWAVTAP